VRVPLRDFARAVTQDSLYLVERPAVVHEEARELVPEVVQSQVRQPCSSSDSAPRLADVLKPLAPMTSKKRTTRVTGLELREGPDGAGVEGNAALLAGLRIRRADREHPPLDVDARTNMGTVLADIENAA